MKLLTLMLIVSFSLLGCLKESSSPTSFTTSSSGGTEGSQPTSSGASGSGSDSGTSSTPANSQYVISDSLQGSTQGRLYGGSLGASGYSPGTGTNHILYRLPQTVSAGYIEVEVRGMDPSRVGSGEDHGFLVMYDGRTISEPITMYDDFKQNYYRWNVHWRQNSSAMKCVITCASPSRSRASTTTPVFPAVSGDDHNRDWSKEPLGSNVNWNPSAWHTLRVQWRGGSFQVFVDGNQVWQASGPYEYAPVDHRIWLGSGPGKYSSELSGIMYRNFKVYAY